MEEVMMEADYSQDDQKVRISDKENTRVASPIVDESKTKIDGCKQQTEKKTLQNGENKVRSDSRYSPSDSESNQDVRKKKKKNRRRHRGGKNHRRWKPYDKMSWTEKQELEEKETRRANQKREEAFASGHPVAPYNTTQFLMDDHCKNEGISPDLHRHNSRDSSASNSSDTSSDFYDEIEEDGFQEKNFMDTFNDIRMQELMNKSKEQLVKELVEVETKLEKLEENRQKHNSSSDSASNANMERDISMEEYQLLKEENEKLRKENELLRSKMDTAQMT